MSEGKRYTMEQVIEITGAAVAVAMAAVIDSLHRHAKFSMPAMQSELERQAQELRHSDPLVVEVAKGILAATRQTLLMSHRDRAGRA